jgi:hypothetical protein
MAKRPRKGNCDHLLAATLTIVEADRREINDSRHKLRLVSVVQAHKQIGVSERRMKGRHKIRGPVFVGGHSRARADRQAPYAVTDTVRSLVSG